MKKGIIILFTISCILILLYFLFQDKKENDAIDFQQINQITKTQTIINLSLKDADIHDFNENEIYTDNKYKEDSIKTHVYIKKNLQEETKKHDKPKVAIIIDDLANPKDIKTFNSLGLKINLSLMPKHSFSKYNPEIAKKLNFYMIHLPLEAQSFEQQGVRVLHKGDSMEIVQKYIDDIKKDFPNLKYINNHTGSKYTASKEDMCKLLKALDKHNITFVDSKTSSSNVIKELFEERKQVYLARNIFLDNESNVEYTSKQLDKALSFANKNGFVIAIGHPKNTTLEAIKKYKQKLANEYEVVYIYELDKWLQNKTINH